jgi:hypothetical protein
VSTVLFPFTFLRRGFKEYLAFRNEVHEQGGGRRVLQKVHPAGELVVRGRLLFPLKGKVYADFEAFWSARFGGFDAFLYKPQNPGARFVHEDPEIDSGSQVDFTLVRRYVDTATLVVKKNGATQTPGTHYTVRNESGGAYALGTSTKCVVHFLSAPGLGADLDFDYEFLYPVRFEGDDLPDEQELEAGGAGGVAVADRIVAVRLRETGPGYSYAAAPNSL